MKTLFAFFLLTSTSLAYAQDNCDPFRGSNDPHSIYRQVMGEFAQQGTQNEIYAIMHQSDYGYLLSDSIMLLQMDLRDCIEALKAGDAAGDSGYHCPEILGYRVDRLIGRHGSLGEISTRAMISQAIVLEKERLSECVVRWNGLLSVYRSNYKPVAVVTQ